MVIIKRNSIYVALCFLIISCNIKSTPKCGDPEVTKLASKLFSEQIKQKLIEENLRENWYSSNEYKDAVAFAEENGYRISDYTEPAKQKFKDSLSNDADFIIKRVTLKNIRSVSLDEKIKQCDCSAEIESNDLLKPINIEYSAQITEDKGNPLYIELLYKIKE